MAKGRRWKGKVPSRLFEDRSLRKVEKIGKMRYKEDSEAGMEETKPISLLCVKFLA